MTGEIPAWLGDLSNLEVLSLGFNQLTGEIPAWLGDLSNLENLSLSDNQLTGCVPAALRNVAHHDLAELGLDFCEADPPGAPTGLTAVVATGKAQVVLSWTAPANTGGAPITGYKIEASDDGNNPWMEVYTTDAATSYTDDGTDANGPTFGVGATQYYRVSAINSVGTGAPSNVAITQDLVARYDANNNDMMDRSEVIAAINNYLN